MACIQSLSILTEQCEITLYSDSQYVVNTINKDWRKHVNRDLWERLTPLLDIHDVTFQWMRGHAGDSGNERADELARIASQGDSLPSDVGYEK